MAPKNRLDVDSFFSEVDQTQEVYNLRSQIEQLEKQLATEQAASVQSQVEASKVVLNTQVEALRDALANSQGGTVAYPVTEIHPNPDQPRKTFPEEVAAMVLSLEREGQLNPIILFPDGTIFDGECRWRAAIRLNWETLDCVFTSQPDNPQQLRRQAYLTSLHRRNLNALDKAEALVALICDEMPDLLPEEVPRIVNRVLTRWKRKQQSLAEKLHLQSLAEQEAAIEQLAIEPTETELFLILLGLQEHPVSLNRNVFPALNLSIDLKIAVREQKLGCSQALILNRLSASELGITDKQAFKLREKGIKEVTGSHLSIAQTQQWVNQERAKYVKPTGLKDRQVKRLLSTVRQLNLADTEPEQLRELQETLKGVLAQIEQQMGS
ncbi:ParB N-terminal domain-containing protein [Merismopedia glauca]|uniref:Transcriptional regulator n=1 Tax=Merismopedia glauca CCAP 1448/3 TaxID=1296344 RepID=A0A2T1BYU0_9CYAN|nr:ParB N-terminal domain-containing protein [Merismopedia glauca]PSB01181.1 transcriptional regulator [Merismopedia glauca CCAP 1448/3]